MATVTLDKADGKAVIDALETLDEISSGITKTQMAIKKRLERAQKQIKVSSAKAKGRGLQQFVCEQISEITGIPFDNQNDDCEIHSREMGQAGADVVLRGTAKKAFPFTVECKNSESLSLVDAVTQAESNKQENADWLLVHKRKRLKEPLAIMAWSTFRKILENGGNK